MDTAKAFEYWGVDPVEHALVAGEVARPPEVFAICEFELEDGKPVEGLVCGWGLVLPDRVEVVFAERGSYGRFDSVDGAMAFFGYSAEEVRIARPRQRVGDTAASTPAANAPTSAANTRTPEANTPASTANTRT